MKAQKTSSYIKEKQKVESALTLKNFFKCFFYKLIGADEGKLFAEIEKASVVSFDIFDTLIKRDVADPKDVFAYIEKQLEKDKRKHLDNFAKRRILAENEVRKAHSDREITLSEIYEKLSINEVEKDYLAQLECQAEIDLSTVNIGIKPLYDLCIDKGKRVFFISDMYLPAEVIEKILRKNGYFEGSLYVSSQKGFTKHNGKLFQYVKEKNGLSYDGWFHVGDSIIGDFLTPKKLGIKAYLVERNPWINPYIDKRRYRKDPEYRRLEHFIDMRIGRYTDPYEKIGYAVLGPLLYGFSVWLEKEVPQNETIVFLAREGALLKRAFEIISERPSAYLRVSRHALNMVKIDQVESCDEILETGINAIKRFSKQGAWARMFGLTDEDVERVFEQNGFSEDTTIVDEDTKKHFLKTIWTTAKENAKGQYALFRTYLEQLEISERCTVVDVGWKGTMQGLLSELGLKMGEKPIRWSGYYLGIHELGNEWPYNVYQKAAYLFNGKKQATANREADHIKESIENTAQFFEMLLLSADGTTKGYATTSDGVQPVLGEPEYDEYTSRKVFGMQEAGIAFVREFADTHMKDNGVLRAGAAIANYESLARVPTLKTLDLFRDFYIFDEVMNPLVGGKFILQYLFHPKQLLSEFGQTVNKSWFLKNVFKIPLPYISIINLARKVTDKKRV